MCLDCLNFVSFRLNPRFSLVVKVTFALRVAPPTLGHFGWHRVTGFDAREMRSDLLKAFLIADF